LQSPEQKYRPLVIVLAAMPVAGSPLKVTENMFRRKLRLSPEQTVKKSAAVLGDPKSSLRYLNL
jgi:hypothetical protein